MGQVPERLLGAALEGGEDSLDGRVVAQPAGVEHEVVVAGEVPGVSVNLADVCAEELARKLEEMQIVLMESQNDTWRAVESLTKNVEKMIRGPKGPRRRRRCPR